MVCFVNLLILVLFSSFDLLAMDVQKTKAGERSKVSAVAAMSSGNTRSRSKESDAEDRLEENQADGLDDLVAGLGKLEIANKNDDVREQSYPQAYFDREIWPALIRLIKQETKGIYGAYFECNVDEFIRCWADQLVDKKDLKGVLLLNKGSKEGPVLSSFEKSRLPLFKVNKQLAHTGKYKGADATKKNMEHMHNKILIFECNQGGKRLMVTGSFNISVSAKESNLENIVVLDDSDIIHDFITEFNAMLAYSNAINEAAKLFKELPMASRGRNAAKKDMLPLAKFKFDIRDLVKKLISDEKERIDGAQFRFTLYDVAQAWIHAKLPGRLIVDGAYAKELIDALELLITHNIELRSISDVMMHHKVLLFARNVGDRPVLLVGSANMTGTSLENNWENVVALQDEVVIRKFRAMLGVLSARSDVIARKNLVYTGKETKSPMVKKMNGMP